jgi:transaldolase
VFVDDSISIPEATSSIEHGAVGATCNWSKLITDDDVISPSYSRRLRFNASDVEVRSRMDDPVGPRIGHELSKKLPDFVRAYPDGVMEPVEFDHFARTRRSLRQLIGACEALDHLMRAVAIPNPDFA